MTNEISGHPALSRTTQGGEMLQADEVVAMLRLTLHNECCAWKDFYWAATDRLYRKGLIADPVNKSKSLVLTVEGLRRSEELYRQLFTRQPR